ncbi:PHD finger protein 14-like isoform X3 [Coregonus clupeaformis]|uniref:PHD finger protein 14-like isoform X3 n=1 Tax=Coregonus clupeaformis TaxID=59861 RepID=UPI001E1C9422|nr:PHD finger protein 14-like isoform X3 [Coregonus clupeaformis]
MDRGSKRRQVKPLAASLLDALDYDSSDDSDFEVGDADASGSEGSAIGSDEEEGSKEESAAEDSDNDSDSDNIGSATDGINEEQTKELTGDDTPTEEKEKTKEQQPSSDTGTTTTKDPAPSGVPRGQRRREEKASDTEAGSGGSGSGTGSGNAEDGGSTTAATQEPKKWNLRRNRPMLDFTTMEELNEMDDYDSEDDNDWRPAAGKKKAKTAAAQKGGSEGEEDEEDDDRGSGSDEDDNGGDDDEAENEEGCSSDSDKEVKKPKRKVKSSSVFDEELTNDSMSQGKSNEEALLERAQTWSAAAQRMEHILICCVCLGDNSEDADEIIQCDNCGVTVHEGCYGVDGESDSIMSSASENSTEPWFCDACKNGVMPSCELCPNQDGIFKETDAGRWVHVVCALYVPGVAFGDIDKLRPVTLTEMNYSKYGAKECSFCEDARFARTGVCISCDAGMCRSYFHVTCAQRDGLLSEAAAEEDIADPFFAYCKQHADRYDRKWKRKNYLALQSYCKASLQDKEKQLAPEAQNPWQARITTRLQQYRARAELSRNTRPQAWVPREKLPRPLTSSASAIRKLMRKAELMGISTDIFPVDTSDISASVDGRRKHKQPALTADFVNYYLERNMRMIQIQDNISEQKNLKDNLESEQEKLHVDYNKLCESLEDLQNVNGVLRSEGQVIWTMLGGILGQKLNSPSVLKAPKERKPSKKEGGAPGKSSNLPAVLYSCGICKKNQDQHLLLLCDTCKLYYHLGCLEPPLTRMPKKTKNSYWQCSECDQASSDDADIAMETLPDGTKRSRRQIKGPIKFIPQEMSPEAKKRDVIVLLKGGFVSQCLLESRLNQRTRGQKRKRVSICEEEKFEVQEPSLRERRQRQSAMQKKTPKADDTRTNCTSCKGPGDNENLVRCDECCLCYHFGCLDPPLKKSPKQTGYGWICQECDTSSSKEEEEEREEEHEEDEEDDSVKEETTEHEIPTEIPN